MQTNDYNGIADLYDIYVPAKHDISFFLEETQSIRGPVLELMAGTGRVSIPLIEAGVDLTCEDSSQEMLAILDEKLKLHGLKARLLSVDIGSLEPDKFAGVIIPFNSFAHLTTTRQQADALRRIRQCLDPGGVFICTLQNPVTRRKQIDGSLRLARKYPMPSTEGYLYLWLTEKFSGEDPSIVEAHEFFEEYDACGVMVKKRCMELNFRLTEREEFEVLAREAEFKIQALYGDYDRSPFDSRVSQYMIWKLTV